MVLWCQLEAAAVNLVAGEKPADVYSEIAVRYTIFEKKTEKSYLVYHC